jgi:hypothetical protein
MVEVRRPEAEPPGSGADSAALPRWDRRLLLVLLPVAGGAGLVAHVLVDVSLPLAFAAIAGAGGLLATVAWRRLSPPARRLLGARLRAGLVGGALGVLAYDAARYGLVALLQLSFQPFHVFEVFGRLFLGDAVSPTTATAAGFAYHVSNGLCFGIAYAVLVRRPGVITGMLWGIALELAMALLYPSWLRIEALSEFLTVSAFGHVIYGGVLGWVVRRRLTPTGTERPA